MLISKLTKINLCNPFAEFKNTKFNIIDTGADDFGWAIFAFKVCDMGILLVNSQQEEVGP